MESCPEMKNICQIARVGPGPGPCSVNHQSQGDMKKTNTSAVLRLAGLFYTMSLVKQDVSCFEKIYMGHR